MLVTGFYRYRVFLINKHSIVFTSRGMLKKVVQQDVHVLIVIRLPSGVYTKPNLRAWYIPQIMDNITAQFELQKILEGVSHRKFFGKLIDKLPALKYMLAKISTVVEVSLDFTYHHTTKMVKGKGVMSDNLSSRTYDHPLRRYSQSRF